ncbi:DUF6221 family protein [Streptomyces cacaoi]|uniref:DUF6221 family protein n=1 Tax=Streptomyces cacaoi TaxID=1898 RepID=UPI003749C4FF
MNAPAHTPRPHHPAFIKARLDEVAELAQRSEAAERCGEWTARGDKVGFRQGDLTGFHHAIAQHVALHDPVRVLPEVEAKRRVLNRHRLSPAEGDPQRSWDDRDEFSQFSAPTSRKYSQLPKLGAQC